MANGPVYWHQGLFLQPQHFQILSQQVPEVLAPLLTHLTPYFWGLAAGGLNETALASGRLEIDAISLLLPNQATLISVPDNAVCASRIIGPDSIPADRSSVVSIGVRSVKAAGHNVTLADNAANMAAAPTRLVALAQPSQVPDLYGEGPPAAVRRLSYVLNLVFDHELDQAGELELIPLARLKRDGDQVILDPTYVGPCLSLAASPTLCTIIRELRDHLLGKAGSIEGYKNLSGRDSLSADFTLLLMALRTIARYAARLDLVAAAPGQSPWHTYGMLRELVGELSIFSSELDALGKNWQNEMVVPPYDHDDLGHCFQATCDCIHGLLGKISAAPRSVVRFNYVEPLWTAVVPDQVLAQTQATGGEVWLVLHADSLEPATLRTKALHALKLSASSTLDSLLVRALPGLSLTPSELPPAGLPRRPSTCYFRVAMAGAQWDEVIKAQSLSMFWGDAPTDLDAQLAVLAR